MGCTCASGTSSSCAVTMARSCAAEAASVPKTSSNSWRRSWPRREIEKDQIAPSVPFSPAEWHSRGHHPHFSYQDTLTPAENSVSWSRRWGAAAGWGRNQLPEKPSLPAPTTQRGLMSTAHCRYRPAWELGGCCSGWGLDFPQLLRVLPQDAALAPEFVAAAEYSGSPSADLEGLLQQLEIVSEEKRIYRVPVFSAEFCQALLEELEHFEQSDMPKGRPNTMNNYGVLMHELGLDEPLVTPLRERFLQPLLALLYPECGGGQLDSHRAFVVKYALGQDLELGCHYDNAELTLNVALGKAFTGGALYFGGLFQAPAALMEPLEVDHVVGQGILHRGGQLHGARPLGTGERWNLVIWLRASAVRNRLCPMCCQKPELVDDEGFGDGFTREESAVVDVCVLT